MTEPQPGEVWIITDPKIGPEPHNVIWPVPGRPIIITQITISYVHWIRAAAEGGAQTGFYERGRWDWDKHATRLWPPVPTWEDLHDEERIPEDLRARALEGAA